MSAASSMRVGWCPGVLRPMPAGDGLIVRIKPRGGRLSLPQGEGLASLSRRAGNGTLTITGRANIQLRGVTEATLPLVTETLADLGLVDGSAEAEAVRNVVSSPLAGLDPTEPFDIRPAVAALEARLAGDPALWRLPAKFAWVVDHGGGLPLRHLPADVRFVLSREAGRGQFAIHLDGCPDAASCAADDLADVAARLAVAYLSLCATYDVPPHRMRDLMACGAGLELLRRAGLEPHCIRDPNRCSADQDFADAIGPHPAGASPWFGVGVPFGWLTAADLERLVSLAGMTRASELRLTPWRSVLVVGCAAREMERAWASLAADEGFVVDRNDPRLAVAACAGAPACHRATTRVRDDASRLASQLPASRPAGIVLHVSGCAKCCAHPDTAPITLVGRDGRYDLVRAGRPSDPPQRTGLRVEEVAAMVGGFDEASV